MSRPKFTKFIAINNPAAGAGTQVTVPSGENWRIRAAHCTLTTSATVANRQPYFTFTKDGAAVYIAGTPVDVPASTTQVFSLAPGAPNIRSTFGTLAHLFIPDFWLPGGGLFQINANAIQPADQWSQIFLAVERA